jgi:hypothetical protein
MQRELLLVPSGLGVALGLVTRKRVSEGGMSWELDYDLAASHSLVDILAQPLQTPLHTK